MIRLHEQTKTVLHEKLEPYLQAHQQDMISLLRELVHLESPSNQPGTQKAVLDRLGEALAAAGYDTMYLPGGVGGGGHLYSRPLTKTGSAAQLLVGHCDTVWPLGTLTTMPFEVQNNLIRGPGVFDMKGGLVQGIFALRALHELDLKPALNPVFFINSDEEIGSPDSSRHIQRLARCVRRAFVLEPALGLSGSLKTARKGGGRFSIHIKGRSAHAGLNPDEGASAILELSHVIQSLHALNDHERGITVNVGQIEGGIQPNVIAPASKAQADVRVTTQADALRIEKAIHSLKATTPGTELHIEGRIKRPPMETSERNQQLWLAAQETGASIGLTLESGLAGGASDGNTTSLYTATLDGLGAVGDGAHAAHEYLYFDKMIERTRLLAHLLMLPADFSSNHRFNAAIHSYATNHREETHP